MDFCSYNIRGLNNKSSFAKDFIRNNKLGLIALLETHVKQENSMAISSFIAPHFSRIFNYDCHPNGRIWIGWDPKFWSIIPTAIHTQHISCLVTNLSTKAQFLASFVYALNTVTERRILWSELEVLYADFVAPNSSSWIILGDFNSCLDLAEKSTPNSTISTGMRDFKLCIEQLEVTDLNYSGKFFTWWDCNINAPVFKKLDRVMINEFWMHQFPLSHCCFLPRGLSDHCPSLTTLGFNVGTVRKPFQVFHHIIEHSQFLSCVTAAWDLEVIGDPWYVLTTKLKKVKDRLKLLNKEHGNLHDAVNSARAELNSFQQLLPPVPTSALLLEEASLSEKLELALRNEEKFLRQKSRVHWLKVGDSNNKFFFNSCLNRWNSNRILSLQDCSGNTVHTHHEISNIAVDYFKTNMVRQHNTSILEDNLDLPCLTAAQKASLEADFCASDVLRALKSMAKGRSPGPDGLSPEFFLAAWHIIGNDVSKGILHFFTNLHLPRIVNATAIALIPKINGPVHMSHFRPISCCNTLYKCISKMLVARLKSIKPSIISSNQTAFIKHRCIGDNIMLAQAICKDYHILRGAPRCTLKLDIHKAFDSISWDFIVDVLRKMCFPEKFINWIRVCITSSMFSVKINGALEGFFASNRGLRQGDPLSPYLFVIGMEILTAYLKKNLSNDALFSYHWRTDKLRLSHLIFADDLLLFCHGDSHSISTIMHSIDQFSKASGLTPNQQKSNWFFLQCGS